MYAYKPLKDAKLLTGIADFFFAAVLFFGGPLFGASELTQEALRFVALGLQPLVGVVIYGMAQAENATRRSGEDVPHLVQKL